MKKDPIWSAAKVLLRVAVTAILLYFVFKKINFRDLSVLVSHSKPVFIVLAFILYALSLLVASWRSQGLLKNIEIDLKYWYYFKLYMLGTLYNVILPGGVGGDGYKIYILRKKYEVKTKRLFLAMLFDRLSGLWAIGFITVSLIIFIPRLGVHYTVPAALLVIGTGVYYIVMYKFFAEYAKTFVATHLKAGLLQSMQVMVVISLLLSQGFKGKFSPYLFSFQLSTMAANAPVSLGGVGIREYTMIHAADYFGMDQKLAVYLSFSFYLISTLIALTGMIFMYYSKDFERAPSPQEAQDLEELKDGPAPDQRAPDR